MRHSSTKNTQGLLPNSMKQHANLSRLLCASAAFVLLQASNASANPTGATVVSGGISINTPQVGQLVVNQSTNQAVINWHNFDIGSGESTQFIQPSSNSVALNRITDGNPTQILGNLSANGKLMIVNGSGVFFGANSHVDVAGLIASTSDTTDADFLAGKTNLSIAGKPDASIVNKGSITAAQGGLVALIAPNVRNDGVIQANLGTVALASAETASVDFYGDNLYSFALDKETTSAAGDSKSAIENNGIISVGGGKVLLTAKVAKNVVDNVINNTGIIEANSAHMEGGTVVLDGGDGNVRVAGKIDASGKTGGKVTVTGENIALAAADINASGANGGGSVKIGGDYQGKGSTPHAKTVTVDANSKINVSATDTGNGGTSIVWSDEVTDFNGSILGTGGVNGGNGGLAEVSSKGELGYNGSADLHATNGNAGLLLLDPNSLFIGSWADHYIGTDHFVNADSIVAALNGGTNVLATTHYGDAPADVNNLSVLSDIIWAGEGSLTLLANNNIIIEADIRSSFNGDSTQGAVNIDAGDLVQMTGADISTVGGDINITTDRMTMMGNSTIKTPAGDVTINNSGRFVSTTSDVIDGNNVSLNQSADGSIQNAINAIGNVNDRSTLNLGNGSWNEDVIINQSRLTLQGDVVGNSVINAANPLSTVITVGAGRHDVTVSDLSVSGGAIGIEASNNIRFTLNNSEINSTGVGLHLDTTNGASVTNNVFSNNFTGIAGENTNFTRVDGNNSFQDSFAGVVFSGDQNLTISNNSFSNLFGGIGLLDVVGAPITGNEFRFVNYGITAEGGNSLFISENNMYYVNYGITTDGTTGVSIVGNWLYGGFGEFEDTLQEEKVFSEEDNDYGSYGIHVVGGLNSAIVDNEVDHFVTGIGVESSTSSSLLSNEVYDTIDDAIFLNGNSHIFAFDNTVNNASNGIHATSNTNVEIVDNDVSDTFEGILAEDNSGMYILENTLVNNFIGADVINSHGTIINDNDISQSFYGLVVSESNNVQLNTNDFADNFTGASFFDSNDAVLTGDIFTNNSLGIALDNSQNARIYEASITSGSEDIGINIRNGSGGTLVRGLTIVGGDIGVLLDGEGSSMQFESNTSSFSGQTWYFQLQNGAMFAGGSTAQADSLDASQQKFENVRASDFTLAQRDAAEAKTIDVEDGIPTIGNVFYKEFGLVGLDGLNQFQEFPFPAGLFSYAGRTITNDPGVTPPTFDVPSLNLSLLGSGGATPPAPAGLTPGQLGGLEPAAGGENPQALASLEPAAGGEANCGNSFLGSGFNNKFDIASCSIKEQQ
jgi:filamentous hemagglutinin family protein